MDKLKKNLLDIYQYNKKLVFLVLGLLIALINLVQGIPLPKVCKNSKKGKFCIEIVFSKL